MDKLNMLYAKDRNTGFPVMTGDVLSVHAYSSVASLVVRFSGYFRRMDGEIINYAVDVSPTSDRAVTSKMQDFGPGFLLSCTAYLLTGNANRGQCYVRAFIRNSQSGEVVPIAQLIGGYVTDDYLPSFPFGKIEGPLEGQGMLRSITGSDPVAGAEISETVPTGARWRVHSVRAQLVASATVASRRPRLTIGDGATTVLQGRCDEDQTAGNTTSYNWASWGTSVSVGAGTEQAMYPFPLLLPASWTISTSTTNIQVDDNWGAPQLWVEEYLEA